MANAMSSPSNSSQRGRAARSEFQIQELLAGQTAGFAQVNASLTELVAQLTAQVGRIKRLERGLKSMTADRDTADSSSTSVRPAPSPRTQRRSQQSGRFTFPRGAPSVPPSTSRGHRSSTSSRRNHEEEDENDDPKEGLTNLLSRGGHATPRVPRTQRAHASTRERGSMHERAVLQAEDGALPVTYTEPIPSCKKIRLTELDFPSV